MSSLLEIVEKHFAVKELDAGKFQTLHIGPMTVRVQHWEVKGFGHVSNMEGSALFGLMKMTSFNVTPTQVDLPLFSIDTISVMGNKTSIVELYGTFLKDDKPFDEKALLAVKEKTESLPDYQAEERWYSPLKLASSWAKKVKKQDTARVDGLAEESLGAYLNEADKMEKLVKGEIIIKEELNAAFANRLVEEGGVSTDMFVKKIGKEATLEFFHKVFYGV